MKAPTKAQRVPAQASAPDPVVEIGHAIQRLWNAHRGAEREAWKLPKGNGERAYFEEYCAQINEWRVAMEVVASFTVARSLEGALVHLALAQDRVIVVDGAQDVDEARREACRLTRLLRSAGDVIADVLGDKCEPIRNVVTSYSWFGNRDDQINWIEVVDEFAAIGRGEKDTGAADAS